MKIFVTAKPKKKKEYVEQIDAEHYTVSVKEPAQQGKANVAVISALAEYFNISKSQIDFISGQTSKLKTFEVPDTLADFEPHSKQKKLF